MNKLLKSVNMGQKTVEMFSSGENYVIKIYVTKTGNQLSRYSFDDKINADAFFDSYDKIA